VSGLYLGRMEYANGDWARIRPLARLDSGVWTSIRDTLQEFPDEGLAFVPPSIGLGHAKEGSFWTFLKERNVRAVPGKDQFVVADVERAMPLIDMSSQTLEETRVQLFEQGIQLPKEYGERAVVAVGASQYCSLAFEPTGGALRRAVPSAETVPLIGLPPAWLRSGAVEGQRFLPLSRLPELPTVRRVNWCDDSEFVERIFSRARKHFTQFGSKDGLPGKEALQRIARALEQGEVFFGNGDDVEFEMERLKSQWPKLVDRFQSLEGVTAFLLDSELAKERIEEARQDAARKEESRLRPILEAQVRESLSKDIDAANERRENVLAAVREAQARLDLSREEMTRLQEAHDELSSKAEETRRQVRAYSNNLRHQLQQLSPREVPFARAFLERIEGLFEESHPHRLPTSVPPWTSPIRNDEPQTLTLEELPESLQNRAESCGLSSLAEIDAFARAGEVVLLVGRCVEQALEAYANTVCAGRMWTLALDPSFIGLDDLWATAPERSPTGLAMAWSHAEAHPDEAVLVCLRAIDASPLHLWLPPLATALRSRGRPRNLLVVATSIGREQEASEYPNHESLLEWLVPVRPNTVPNGSLRALAGLTNSNAERSALKFSKDMPGSLQLTADQAVALSRLAGDSVTRAARLALATNHANGTGGLFLDWVAALEQPQATVPRHTWSGTDELKSLRHQD